jgi:hypothetical protein
MKSSKLFVLVGLVVVVLMGAKFGLRVGLNQSEAAVNLRAPGNCTGAWSLCTNAFTSNNTYSTGLGTIGSWYDYGYNFATSSTSTSTPTTTQIRIASVRVAVEGHMEKRGSKCPANQITLKMSRDSGVSFGPAHLVSLPCGVEATVWVDVTPDFPWVPTDLNGSKPVVQLACKGSLICYIDWLPLEVVTLP